MLHSISETDGKNCENTILLSSELAELMPGVETSLQAHARNEAILQLKCESPINPISVQQLPTARFVLSRSLSSLCEILQNGYIRNLFYFQCRPGYKSMQKTVLYKYTKLLQEWMKQHFIQQMPRQLLCDLVRINLRIRVDFSQSFGTESLFVSLTVF